MAALAAAVLQAAVDGGLNREPQSVVCALNASTMLALWMALSSLLAWRG